ncbi:MAG TPA: M28 family peptidase [Pirellulales bacterium]|jgi:Zn-dependent M28 family amino/carboxypeptidase|nr:M28 family peptidase [Pirellulales bacterium]
MSGGRNLVGHCGARRWNLARLGIAAILGGAMTAMLLNRVSCLAQTPAPQTQVIPTSATQLLPMEHAEKKPMAIQPGPSFSGPLAKLTDHETALAAALRKDVEKLAGEIGDRSIPKYAKLVEAAAFIEKSFRAAGHQVARQTYEVKGRKCANVEVEIKGTKAADEIVVVGAHYDSIAGTTGANDNGSGVAALLALARAFSGKQTERTLRLVAFANEEPPYFQEEEMGSLHYAKRCRERSENVVGMLSLETIGYYSDEPESQHYPPPLALLYPSTGNFIAFVANPRSDALVREVAASFRKHARFPSEWGVAPAVIPGVGWSDHWSFWEQGYPGVMITDTALFRYPHYHLKSDTPDKLDYSRMARVVTGLEHVLVDLTTARRATADGKP